MPSASGSSPASRVRHGIAKTSPASVQAGISSQGTLPAKTTSDSTPCRFARASSRPRWGPSPTRRSLAPGSSARTDGHDSIRVSCPFRGTSRPVHTTTGVVSPIPSCDRTSAPPHPGWKRSVSTPGESRCMREAASAVSALEISSRHHSLT